MVSVSSLTLAHGHASVSVMSFRDSQVSFQLFPVSLLFLLKREDVQLGSGLLKLFEFFASVLSYTRNVCDASVAVAQTHTQSKKKRGGNRRTFADNE